MHGALNYRVMAILCLENNKKTIKEYETREYKIIYCNKNKKLHFLEDLLEISPVGTLKCD